MSTLIEFFVTHDELIGILTTVENKCPVHYAVADVVPSKHPQVYESVVDIPKLSVTSHGDYNHTTTYLIQQRSQSFASRKIKRDDGTVWYATDWESCPGSMSFQPSAIFKRKAIILGRAAVEDREADSYPIYKLIASGIRSITKKECGVFVSQAADSLRKAGYRLTRNVKSPSKYDITQ